MASVSAAEDLFGIIGDDVLTHYLVPHLHEYALASVACVSKHLRGMTLVEASKRVERRRYPLQVGTVVNAGLLARLQSDEERANDLHVRLLGSIYRQNMPDCVCLLSALYALDPLVLNRPDAVPKVILKQEPTRTWVLYFLPVLGEGLCKSNLRDIEPATYDEDWAVRSAALIAMREATRSFSHQDLEPFAEIFAQRLEDVSDTTCRTALACMMRLSPSKIAQHQASLRRIVEDDAQTDRARGLARRALSLAGLAVLD